MFYKEYKTYTSTLEEKIKENLSNLSLDENLFYQLVNITNEEDIVELFNAAYNVEELVDNWDIYEQIVGYLDYLLEENPNEFHLAMKSIWENSEIFDELSYDDIKYLLENWLEILEEENIDNPCDEECIEDIKEVLDEATEVIENKKRHEEKINKAKIEYQNINFKENGFLVEANVSVDDKDYFIGIEYNDNIRHKFFAKVVDGEHDVNAIILRRLYNVMNENKLNDKERHLIKETIDLVARIFNENYLQWIKELEKRTTIER